MKYTINELANSKGITPLVREALLQMEAELEATNRQVEILSDALAESRREVAALKAVQEPLEYWNAVEGWVKIDEVREHFDSVGCGTIYKTAGDGRVPLTAAQPAVPLTDEQIDVLRESKSKGRGAGWSFDFKGFARAIEAAHGIKEKNT
jgi:hypothetical protein